jgi:hypothetical protein
MATALARRSRPTINIRMPSRGARLARRAGGAVAKAAWSEKHTVTALLAAGILGYMQRPAAAGAPARTPLPHIAALGEAGTYAAAAFVIGKATGSVVAQHVATGLGCVAIAQMASAPATVVAGAGVHGMSGVLHG